MLNPLHEFVNLVKSNMEAIIGLIGVIIGGLITYFVERNLQNRQFKKEAKERKETWKCYLEILKNEIEAEHKRLWSLRDSIYGYPQEYFDSTIKRTVLQEIVKTPLFVTHNKIFNRVNLLIQRYEKINSQIRLVQDYIAGKIASIEDRDFKLNREREHLSNLVNGAISEDIIKNDNKLYLVVKLEEIQKLI